MLDLRGQASHESVGEGGHSGVIELRDDTSRESTTIKKGKGGTHRRTATRRRNEANAIGWVSIEAQLMFRS